LAGSAAKLMVLKMQAISGAKYKQLCKKRAITSPGRYANSHYHYYFTKNSQT